MCSRDFSCNVIELGLGAQKTSSYRGFRIVDLTRGFFGRTENRVPSTGAWGYHVFQAEACVMECNRKCLNFQRPRKLRLFLFNSIAGFRLESVMSPAPRLRYPAVSPPKSSKIFDPPENHQKSLATGSGTTCAESGVPETTGEKFFSSNGWHRAIFKHFPSGPG